MQHSIVAMPKSDFVPRADDARVGYFSKQVNDMTNTGAVNYKDVIHRWNLVKKDPKRSTIRTSKNQYCGTLKNTTP